MDAKDAAAPPPPPPLANGSVDANPLEPVSQIINRHKRSNSIGAAAAAATTPAFKPRSATPTPVTRPEKSDGDDNKLRPLSVDSAPPPIDDARYKINLRLEARFTVILAIVLAVVAVCAGALVGAVFFLRNGALIGPSIRHHLQHVAFSAECDPVDYRDIARGSLLAGSVDAAELEHDLLYHLHANNRTILCAQHVGLNPCMCVLRLEAALGPSTVRTAHQTMYNVDVLTYSPLDEFSSLERLYECHLPRLTNRFESVLVGYFDSRGKYFQSTVTNTSAQAVQYAFELQHLIGDCQRGGSALLQEYLVSRAANPRRGGNAALLPTRKSIGQ